MAVCFGGGKVGSGPVPAVLGSVAISPQEVSRTRHESAVVGANAGTLELRRFVFIELSVAPLARSLPPRTVHACR